MRNTAIVAARAKPTGLPWIPSHQRAADAVVAEAAICRLVLLCVLVMIYLAWLIEEHPRLTDRLIEYGQVLPDDADFLFYRLLTG